MTIKLLTPRDLNVGGRYVTHPAGSLVTLGSATEAGLIASKEATADLAGGIVYAPPVPSGQPVKVEAIPSGPGLEIQDGSETRSFVTAEMSGGVPTGNFMQPSRAAKSRCRWGAAALARSCWPLPTAYPLTDRLTAMRR